MTAIIGALLGLFGSLLPEVLRFFNMKEDHKHEREMAKIQMEAQMQAHTEKLEEINAQADIAEVQALYSFAEPKVTGSRILDGLVSLYQSSVRPTITYAFMGLYILVKYSMFYMALQKESLWQVALTQIWSSEDFAIFSTILAFWFGGRFLKFALSRSAPLGIPTRIANGFTKGVKNGVK